MQTITLTTTEAAVAGGVLGTIGALAIAWGILALIGGWKMLKKAGEPGWKILIPIYDLYILFKIAGVKNWFWGYIAMIVVCTIIMVAQGIDPNTAQLSAETFSSKPVGMVAFVVESFFSVYVMAVWSVRTSKVFGHASGYAIGLFFLTSLFMMILGFGDSKYDKKALKK